MIRMEAKAWRWPCRFALWKSRIEGILGGDHSSVLYGVLCKLDQFCSCTFIICTKITLGYAARKCKLWIIS